MPPMPAQQSSASVCGTFCSDCLALAWRWRRQAYAEQRFRGGRTERGVHLAEAGRRGRQAHNKNGTRTSHAAAADGVQRLRGRRSDLTFETLKEEQK